jgi:hypothetical protein
VQQNLRFSIWNRNKSEWRKVQWLFWVISGSERRRPRHATGTNQVFYIYDTNTARETITPCIYAERFLQIHCVQYAIHVYIHTYLVNSICCFSISVMGHS